MNILTLNTHSWIEENPLEKLEQLAQGICSENYDVIALQEVNQSMTASAVSTDEFFHAPKENQVPIKDDNFALCLVARLHELGASYHWSWTASHIGYDKYDEGLAILSKQPLEPTDFYASKSKDYTDYHTRRLLLAKTEIEGHEVVVVSVHFSWWKNDLGEEAFLHEWLTLKEQLEQVSVPIFVMGDFNNAAHVADEGYHYLTSQDTLSDSFVQARLHNGEFTVEHAIDGWSENSEKLRIDYIFVSPVVQIEEYAVVFNSKQMPVVSDHFGVAVRGRL
ncbi:MAG: endonuclease/exonuclease/phosphatase family protein [Lactobacillales bacterium]|jgi:maltose 6'-phosphate phosphatase|nr:endonuclease/exonuclease/phosphatase family protein [Lactobacillales bacterium]